ncbi:NUDIX hydrolase [Melghirimyces algeriensis]|uniref:ADP-ribose pyrophosphatase YjhB, NUDIX family n=1 Tax=Melghirimyces algeriensis TaxID=910412 RepID=A0A521BVN0_9BACL|nr:NUDIX hydrolase [Melghirimyces algeriensis]SMO50470.1 ADP-ribose pyrophosphatase YjhB, NUDIX family [Melghirimyces algeriensis]
MKEVSAGGVVYRREKGSYSILLIEDRYSRWTLPKGKQEQGETLEETALREIEEETGIQGIIKQPLERITYQYFHPDYGDVTKEVYYFLVEAKQGQATPQLSEISRVAWLSPEEAWNKQEHEGYDNNHSVMLKAYQCLEI